jgi:hypothetical protein
MRPDAIRANLYHAPVENGMGNCAVGVSESPAVEVATRNSGIEFWCQMMGIYATMRFSFSPNTFLASESAFLCIR